VKQKTSASLNLEEVIKKYRPVITFKVIKSIGSQTPDWEDIVEEILTNVIEKIQTGQFRGESSIGTFIYTITQRRIIDFIRLKSKSFSHVPEPEPYKSPVEALENKEMADLAYQAIKKLKPKYREILYLYYYRGLTREEVAQRLGITPKKVSERVHYALKLVKKNLKIKK
jgi:RNA polymerase sigma-70 factor (ECF subfamily)